MLLFFAVSGIWQTLGFGRRGPLALLSTIHMQTSLKSHATLTSPILRDFILLTAVGFIATTLLGIIMAVTQGGHRRVGFYCLAFGVLFPLAVILVSQLAR